MATRAAIYARYSSDNQRYESAAAQLRICREYCESHGYTIVQEYVDEAQTGKDANREAFQQMVKDAKNFDVALFHKIDRNARNEYDYYFYKGQLRNSGVRLEYADQTIDDSPEGQMMEAMLVGMAAYYSRNLAREVQKGMRENAHQAKHNGGRPALGYDVMSGSYVINEKEAPIVRHIFIRRAEGASYNTIIAELNSFGWRTKRNVTFGKNSILEILRNQKYIGTYQYGKALNLPKRNNHQAPDENTITIKDAVPAIVDKQTWDLVQSRMRKQLNGSGNAKREYLLTGHIFCHFGAAMHGVSTTNDKGVRYWYYKCGEAHQKTGASGDHQRISLDEVEAQVWTEIKDKLLAPSRRAEILQEIRGAQLSVLDSQTDELEALEAIKKDTTSRIEKMWDAIETGSIDTKVAAERIKIQTERRDGAQARIDDIGRKYKKIYLSDDQLNALLDYFDKIEKQPRAARLLVQMLSVKVTVSPEAVHFKAVLVIDGAGEPGPFVHQLIYDVFFGRGTSKSKQTERTFQSLL